MNIGMILDKAFVSDARVQNEAATLIEAGHQVYLYCLQFGGNAPLRQDVDGLKVCRFRVPPWMYNLSALAYTTTNYHSRLEPSLKAFIEETGVDVLHVHDMRVSRAVERVNAHYGLPVILDLHENQPEIMKYYHHVNTVLGNLLISPDRWKQFEQEYIDKADRVIVVTPQARNYYVETFGSDPEKIISLPNTVLPEFYENYELDQEILSRYRDSFPILYWGDTGFRRGVTTAIDAMEAILANIPNARLILAGKSKSDKQLKVYISKSGLGRVIDMPGWQPFDKFQSYITASKVCICPIHRNIHHDTTYANKIFQYMSLARPIVVSDCPAQQAVVEQNDCGLVHLDQDAGDMAAKIISLHENTDLYERLAANAARAVRENLNWDRTKQPLIDLYNGL